jgi:RNA polymerase sigma factor (sigma-70 family)
MLGTIVPTEAVVERLRRARSRRIRADDSDHELVASVSRGNELALAELYDRHGSLAYGVALRVTRDRALAEDAVQETFVQLWKHAELIDPRRTSVAAWIVLLARRRAIDLTRCETRTTRPLPVSPSELETPAAEEHALTNLEGRRARAAVRTLAPDQLAVIELAYYQGLSQTEIARALAVPLGTVKSRTFAALACLRSALGDDADQPTARSLAPQPG